MNSTFHDYVCNCVIPSVEYCRCWPGRWSRKGCSSRCRQRRSPYSHQRPSTNASAVGDPLANRDQPTPYYICIYIHIYFPKHRCKSIRGSYHSEKRITLCIASLEVTDYDSYDSYGSQWPFPAVLPASKLPTIRMIPMISIFLIIPMAPSGHSQLYCQPRGYRLFR